MSCSTRATQRISIISRQLSTNTRMQGLPNGELSVESNPTNGLVTFTFNRPKSLNALNLDQVMHIDEHMRGLKSSSSCSAVLFRGEGDRAFCAGGDVLQIASSAAAKSDWNRRWFSSEFLLNHYISSFKKPVISIWKGIVMGGGVGISIYGSHRIATESTVFAMPETSIGFFPDVGGSYFLSHYVKHPGLGLYLGMTGHRLTGTDTLACGLATHFVESSKISALTEALGLRSDFDSVISEFSSRPVSSGLSPDFLMSVEKYFSKNATFADLWNQLQDGANKGDEFGIETLKIIRSKCPLTVCVWFESFRLASTQSLAQVLEREYHMCIQVTEVDSHNFREGVRALLVDKGKGAPADYTPKCVEEVTDSMVAGIIGSSAGGDIGSCLKEQKLMY